MGLLKAAVKDLMGYKRMLMKQFEERNVAVSEDVGGPSFLREIWPAGAFSKQKARFLASLWEATASLKCAAWSSHSLRNGTFSMTWQMESEAELLAG